MYTRLISMFAAGGPAEPAPLQNHCRRAWDTQHRYRGEAADGIEPALGKGREQRIRDVATAQFSQRGGAVRRCSRLRRSPRHCCDAGG